MCLSNLAHLYRVRLKARTILVQELFAVLGIAIGVALLFASQVASTSLSGSGAKLGEGLVGQAQYQLKARSSQGFSESLLSQVAALPGVHTAVPVLEQETTIAGPAGSRSVDLLATEPRFVNLGGSLRHLGYAELIKLLGISLPAPMAKAIGARPHNDIKVQVGAALVEARIGAELNASQIGGLVDSPIAIAPLLYAQALTGLEGRLTRIFVKVDPGHDRAVHSELVKLASGLIDVEPANYDATLFNQAATPIKQSTETFAAIAALVGFMFAYCSLLLTVPHRRDLVRDLRRNGATRRDVVNALLFDALVLGGVASLLGLAIGELLALLVFHSNPSYLTFAFPVGSEHIVTWSSIALAVGVGMLSACLGVLIPLRDVWKRPFGLPGSRGQSRYRLQIAVMFIAGAIFLGVTTAILLVAPGSAIVGVAGLMLALALVLPLAIDLFEVFFRHLLRSAGRGSAQIALVELRSSSARTWSTAIAATGAIAVFGSVTIEGARVNLQAGLDRLTNQLSAVADVWVLPRGEQDLLATTPFGGVPASTFASRPGVRAVGAFRAAFLEFAGRRVWVLAPPLTASSPLLASQLAVGSLNMATARLRARGWAVISQTLAHELNLHIGQAFTVPTPSPITFRVAALSTNLGWPPGALVINGEDFARAWNSSDPTAYTVTLAPNASPEGARRAIQQSLGPGSSLMAQTTRQRAHAWSAASHHGLGSLRRIAWIVLVAGVLATAMSMGAMIWQRRRRFARMKVQGVDTKTLWLALVWESGMLLGSGCLVGAAFGSYGQIFVSRALTNVTGYPVIFSADPLVVASCFLLVTMVAAAIISVPGYRAASVAARP